MFNFNKFLLIILLATNSNLIKAQIYGCSDKFATNYNSKATINDGSCIYPIITLPTTFKNSFGSNIPESSGIVFTNGKLWTHNDSGNPATIFSVDTNNGNTLQTVYIDNFPNTDWEDITADDNYIYISDCGNNNGIRKDLKILKIAKSDIGNNTEVHVNAQAINISYIDQTTFISSSSHNFDCESILSIENQLYLFSKDRGDLQTRVYKVSKTPGTYILTPFTSFNTKGLICGADYDPIKNEVALVGYLSGHLKSFVWILNDFKADSFFTGNKRRIEIGDGADWQTEGICYKSSGQIYISCESGGKYANSTLSEIKKSEWEVSTTSIRECINSDLILSIYPNPSIENIHIELNEMIKSIQLINILGQQVYFSMINNHSFNISTDQLKINKGTYFLKITTNTQTITKQIVLN